MATPQHAAIGKLDQALSKIEELLQALKDGTLLASGPSRPAAAPVAAVAAPPAAAPAAAEEAAAAAPTTATTERTTSVAPDVASEKSVKVSKFSSKFLIFRIVKIDRGLIYLGVIYQNDQL